MLHDSGNLQAKASQLFGQLACIVRRQTTAAQQSAKHLRFQHQPVGDIGRIDNLGQISAAHQRTVS